MFIRVLGGTDRRANSCYINQIDIRFSNHKKSNLKGYVSIAVLTSVLSLASPTLSFAGELNNSGKNCVNADNCITNFDYIQNGTIDAADLATDSVNHHEIQTGAVRSDEIQDNAVKAVDLNSDTAGDGLGQDGAGALEVKTDGNTIETSGDKIRVKNDGIKSQHIADDQVRSEHLHSNTAGDGLGQDGAGALEVKTDGSTIETSGDKIRVKNDGIKSQHIADDQVRSEHLHSNTAGDGLGQDGAGALEVKTDGSTIETSGDKIRVKNDGIKSQHIADDQVRSEHLHSNTAGDGLGQDGAGALEVKTDGNTIETSGDKIRVKNDGIKSQHIADDQVRSEHLHSNTAGDGLGQDGAGALEVKTDGSTIETSGDKIRVKNDGIKSQHIADDQVRSEHLHSNTAGDGLGQDGAGALEVKTDGNTIETSGDKIRVKNDGIKSQHIADDQVRSEHLHSNTAGDGLGQDGAGALEVKTDGNTIETSGDKIRVKNDGIKSQHIADDQVRSEHLHSNTAGDGLGQDGAGALEVKTDGNTIETSGDKIRVKNDGIKSQHIADDQVRSEHLHSNTAGDGLGQDGAGALEVKTDGNTIETSGDKIRVKNDGIKSQHIADDQVRSEHLHSNTAGDGLGQDGAGALEVKTDGNTIETSGDKIRVKNGGIKSQHIQNGTIKSEDIGNGQVKEDNIMNKAVTTKKIDNGAVTNSKLADDAVTSDKIKDNTIRSEDIKDGTIAFVDLAPEVNDKIKSNMMATQQNALDIKKNRDDIQKNREGIALAIALSGGSSLNANENFAIDLSVGFFDDETAAALSAIGRIGRFGNANVYLHGGVGFTDNEVGGRGSIRFAF